MDFDPKYLLSVIEYIDILGYFHKHRFSKWILMMPANSQDLSHAKGRVSVIIPFKDGAKTLKRAISSILENSEVGELFLVNDKSSDDYLDVIQAFHDPRIILLDNAGSGIADAFNTALKLSTCDYVARCDDDDLYVAGRFTHQIKELDSNPEVIAVCGQHLVRLEDGRELGKLPLYDESKDISGQLRKGIAEVYFTTCLVRRSILTDMGGKRSYFVACQDLDLLFRLGMQGKVLYFPHVVYIHYLRQGSISHRMRRARHNFFLTQSKKFAEQREKRGKDDLDEGHAEEWSGTDETRETKVEYLNSRATGILTANAFYNQKHGRNKMALSQIIRAISLNCFSYTTWKSFLTIFVRSVIFPLK